MSDWSSDVCSSDLLERQRHRGDSENLNHCIRSFRCHDRSRSRIVATSDFLPRKSAVCLPQDIPLTASPNGGPQGSPFFCCGPARRPPNQIAASVIVNDRKSLVKGKSVSVMV